MKDDSMPTDHRAMLANIKRFDQLIVYLRDEMGWPIESDDLEELTFEYSPEELGIDAKNAAKIESIKRLRPLSPRQPWGIFFVKFEPKRLPVVVLRRILSQVTLRKRASANSAERTAWAANDLLFVSNYGEGDDRTITFAHFYQDETKQDLPVLKVLGWNDDDTALHLDGVASELTTKLAWPANESDSLTWRMQWQSAFTLRHGEVITTSKDLSIRLAELARTIRKRINTALRIENDSGPLKKIMKAFQDALIHDLDADGFADMYAQTIAYGLLTARITNPKRGTADDLHMQMPVTNPFLKEMMETFLSIGGRRGKAGGPGIDFDELGVSEVVELLDHAKMDAVLRDFGDRNPQEDPVIHFYELFLKEYDANMRVQRGVFYTPRSVVSYIVRSVDELLRTEFNLQDGLADITTWKEILKRHTGLKIPEGTSPDQFFVQILDPATGTGTFLVETIDLIHHTLRAKWKTQGHSEKQIEDLWNEYVPKYLLPRLHGFELLMAPYAIAHLKIGLKLFETGYNFSSEERVRVFLTNSLEPASDIGQLTLTGIFKAIAHEAQAVNAIKRNQRFTVVIGNPPYSVISSNMSESAQKIVNAYRIVDGEALNERKIWLQDDYVKFIRTAQVMIEQADVGIFGFITNNGYLNNPTFRGMRQSLMGTYQQLRVIDLHGNANKKEQSPDNSKDENVFDIRQGVAICVATRDKAKDSIFHADLWGNRESKYQWLVTHNIVNTSFEKLKPDSPYYFFKPQNIDFRAEYYSYWQITEAMPLNAAGVITSRDSFVIGFSKEEILDRIKVFLDKKLSDDEVSARLGLSENYAWRVKDARLELRTCKDLSACFTNILYRPFDVRHIFYHPAVVWRPRSTVMSHMRPGTNLALLTARSNKSSGTDHFFCSKWLSEAKTAEYSTQSAAFPLYFLNDAITGQSRSNNSTKRPNFSSVFMKDLSTSLQLPQNAQYSLPEGLTPEDVFNYAYAIFYSPNYRSRYAEFLKSDFPRLPLTGSLGLFNALALLGGKLVALHLMELPKLEQSSTKFISDGNSEVEKISWSNNTVWINKTHTTGFKGVPETVWNFHIGGYQVCDKWLKDRKGRKLSQADLAHYQKIVFALTETIRLMQEIDDVIENHGGWPSAFQTDNTKAQASHQNLLKF